MSQHVDLDIRNVGFRTGTDEELMALHAVEAPIARERGSNRMPQPIESYIAYARNLPSPFSDHAWLAQTSDGAPIAAGFCWSNSAGDHRVMECDVLVRQDRRREAIGCRLMAVICEVTASEGRSLLTWSTFDAVPAGDAFSRRLRARVGRVSRTSELTISKVNSTTLERWSYAERARGLGYSLEMVKGTFPEHLRRDAAKLHHIMQTAPREGLDVGDVSIDAEFVAELDRSLVNSGRTRWTVIMRDPLGACVGGTEVIFEPEDLSTVMQQNTGVDPAHRGLGLAKWAKATMIERIRDERPEARTVRTDNAFSNDPMLAINLALGFKITGTRTEWQAQVDHVHELADDLGRA